MRRIALCLACGVLLALSSGCVNLVPDPAETTAGQSATPTRLPALPAGCPAAGGLTAPEPLGVLAGQEGAEELLSRFSDWANAGTAMITNEPAWMAPGAGKCLEALASAIGRLYGQVLFSRNGDDTLTRFSEALVAENLANLHRSSVQGQGSHAEFWMQSLLGSTTSGTGRLVKMAVRVQPGDSLEHFRVEEWTVVLEPQDGGLAVEHISGFRQADNRV